MLSLLSGPLCSIILCVLAGIALRYALWYGNTEETPPDESAPGNLAQNRIDELERQLAAARQAQQTFETDYRQLCEEFDRYRQDATTRDSETRIRLAMMDELETTVERLREELSLASQSNAQLEARLDAVQQTAGTSDDVAAQQLNSILAELDQAQQAAAEAEAESDSQRSELAAASKKVGELTNSLEVASGEKTTLEARCCELEATLESQVVRESELGEQLATLTADTRFTDDLRHQLTGMQAAFQQRTSDLDTITEERDALSAQVGDTLRRLDEAQQELHAATSDISRLHEQLAGAQSESESLTEERINLATELETIRRQAAGQHGMHEQRIAELQREVELGQGEIAQLSNENTALIKEFTHLRSRTKGELAVAYEKVQALETDLQTRLDEAHRGFKSELTFKDEQLEQRLRHQEAETAVRLSALEAERDGLNEQLQRERIEREQKLADEIVLRTDSLRSENESQLATMTGEIAALNNRIRDLQTEKEELLNGLHREQDLRESVETRWGKLSTQSDELISSREAATTKLKQFERRMGSLVEELEEAEKQLSIRDGSLGEFRIENKELAAQLERERQERANLQRALNVQAETLEKLRDDSASLETLLERQAQVQSSLQQHALKLRTVAPHDDPIDPNIERYTTAAAPGEGQRTPGVYAFDSASEPEESTITRIDPILGKVYAATPEHRDDLKLISGVGETLEKKLNRLGIYRFEQIMRWDSHAVDEFSNILAFKDRIEREKWIDQAGRLYHLHHGLGKAA